MYIFFSLIFNNLDVIFIYLYVIICKYECYSDIAPNKQTNTNNLIFKKMKATNNKQIKLILNVESNKEIQKCIKSKLPYYSNEQFCDDAQRYIKAIQERRMFCVICSVSNSGMSRTLSFYAHEKNKTLKNYSLLNFNAFFIALGYSQSKNKGFTIGGCGMDMVFATNYNIIHRLFRLGFINKKQCESLAQNTPTNL